MQIRPKVLRKWDVGEMQVHGIRIIPSSPYAGEEGRGSGSIKLKEILLLVI